MLLAKNYDKCEFVIVIEQILSVFFWVTVYIVCCSLFIKNGEYDVQHLLTKQYHSHDLLSQTGARCHGNAQT